MSNYQPKRVTILSPYPRLHISCSPPFRIGVAVLITALDYVAFYVDTDVSAEHAVSTFRDEPEHGGSMFLRNASILGVAV
jgi:hypothetical protein